VKARGAFTLIYYELWTWRGRLKIEGTDWPSITRMTPRAWKAIEAEVLSAFEITDGYILEPEMIDQLAFIDSQAAQKREAGLRSGVARALKSLPGQQNR